MGASATARATARATASATAKEERRAFGRAEAPSARYLLVGLEAPPFRLEALNDGRKVLPVELILPVEPILPVGLILPAGLIRLSLWRGFGRFVFCQVLHGAAGEAGGLPDDEVGGDVVLALAGGLVCCFDVGAQGGEGGACEFVAGHLNGGERRDRDLGDVDVVEADDGEIVGHAEAGAVELVQDADGRHVVGAHHGSWHRPGDEELCHGGDAAFERVIAFDDPRRGRWDAALLQRPGEGCGARLGRVKFFGTGDEGDASVAQGGEMLHALPDAVMVVHLEQADTGAFGRDVDKHHWHVAFGELVEQRLFDAEGHHRDALDLALEHAADAVRHAFGIVVGRTDEDLVAVLDGDIFEALDQLGKNGLVMSETMRPKRRLRPDTSARAWVLGK